MAIPSMVTNRTQHSPIGQFAKQGHRQIPALTSHDGKISPNNQASWKLGIELKK
jgi:hypothetical protein